MWHQWEPKETKVANLPSLIARIVHSGGWDGPLPPLLVGVTAALIAMVLALELFAQHPIQVLAPVLTAIGAFAGHAAGHAAAKQ
jgi:hypothetical protein